MFKKEYLTIPNILSLSRIVLLPILFIFISLRMYLTFTVAYAILGMTDMFDGMIARRFNMETDIGKLLDSIADMVFFLSSAYFIHILYTDFLSPNMTLFFVFIGIMLLSFVVSYIRCGKVILMHNFLAKLCAVLVYFLVISSYLMNTTLLITFIIALYIAAFTEAIIMFIKFGDVDPDTLSIFSLMKSDK
ncbi:MAG TPA: CDP-alcohol phosphatidyltransferase family protein [Thermoclostridium sp.]|nr:CDP-alcohol phosphatidyltransferase family protein [Thermoclostridium sp.]